MTTTCPTCESEDNKFCSDAFHFHPTPPSAADALREWIKQSKDSIVFLAQYDQLLAGHASLDAEIAGLKEETLKFRDLVFETVDKFNARLEMSWKNCDELKSEVQRLTKQLMGDNEGALLVSDLTENCRTLRAEVETLRKERDAEKERRQELETTLDDANTDYAVLTTQLAAVKAEVESHEKVHASHRKWVRQLDVIWNTEKDAARQASLVDVVEQIEKELPTLRASLTSAQTIAGELAGALGRLRSEVLAHDFNEHWESYLDAGTLLARYRAQQHPTGKEAEEEKRAEKSEPG